MASMFTPRARNRGSALVTDLPPGCRMAMKARQIASPLWLSDHVVVVQSGLLLARHEPRPGVRRSEVLAAGDVVAEAMCDVTPPATLTSLVASKLVVLDVPQAEEAFFETVESAQWILHRMALRVRGAENHRNNLRTTTVRTRVARFLIDWCERHRTAHVPGPYNGGISISQLAEIVGASRAAVHGSLLTFERGGLLHLEHGGVTVARVQAMRPHARHTQPYLHRELRGLVVVDGLRRRSA